MKRALMVLILGLCTTSVGLHATSGTIRFRGLIVQGTCADAVSATRSSGSRQVQGRCESGVAVTYGTRNVPIYTERTTKINGPTGIATLDYYVDLVRSSSAAQVQLLTRDYV
jgi:type 1 fimbria pilin